MKDIVKQIQLNVTQDDEVSFKRICADLLRTEYQGKTAEDKVPLGIAIGFPVALLCLLLILAVLYYKHIKRLKLKNEYISKMYARTVESEELNPEGFSKKSFSLPMQPEILRSERRQPLQTIFVREDEDQTAISSRSSVSSRSDHSKTHSVSSPQNSPVPTINLLDCNEHGCKFVKSITPE